jgi:PAS domain S-box-containing protein
VDDNEAQRYAVARLLRAAGFSVVEAQTGAQALQHAPSSDLVVLDIGLPDVSGLEVCRRLKSNPLTSRIPILHLSASFTNSEARVLGLDSGADAYMVQPADPNELLATLRALLRIRHAERERERLVAELETKNQELSHIEWLLTARKQNGHHTLPQPYGDLAELNTDREVLDAVGSRMLTDVAEDYLGLLETSSAIFEKNGDYAMGVFASGWCRHLDAASRNLCNTNDNREAMDSGNWICHESCWSCSKEAMQTGEATDIECPGKLHLYAVPIIAGGEVVGAINFAYGDPPREGTVVKAIAGTFDVDLEELETLSGEYRTRPPFMIDLAKRRLRTTARLIGEIVERRRFERQRDELLQRERAARQQAEEAQQRITGVLESITDAFFLLDKSWRFTYVNSQAEKLLQRERGDLIGKSMWRELPNLSSKRLREQYVSACAADSCFSFEQYYAPLRKWFEVHVYPGDHDVSVYFQDVTDRKNTEEALRMTEKLAAAGRMAGTLAHEINNPMAAVTNLLYLLSHQPQLDPASRAYVSLAEEELERVQHIIKNTLGFYRESKTAVALEMAEILDSVLELYSRRLQDKGIEVKRRYDYRGSILGFPGELRQVFANLIGNAIEAVGEDGRIRLHVRTACDRSGPEPRPGVRVVVADRGTGIPAEYRSRIFQPFFTSKGENGTGLGLWVSRGIVSKHNGTIRMRTSTRPGRSGTCFALFFPCGNPEPAVELDSGTAA